MTTIPNSPEWGEDTYWESKARSRWGSYISEVENRVILQAHDLARDPKIALEIGVEGGRWSKLLVDLGWDLICTDINPKTLAICQRRIPEANCILVSKRDTTLPASPGSLGLILCIEVIPVLRSDWFIKEAFRALQCGGLVVGVFENKLSLRGYIQSNLLPKSQNIIYYINFRLSN